MINVVAIMLMVLVGGAIGYLFGTLVESFEYNRRRRNCVCIRKHR